MKTHHNKYTNPPKMSTFSNPSKDSPKPQNPDFPEKVIKDIGNLSKTF